MQNRSKRQAVKLTDMRLDQEEQNQEEQKQEEIVKDQDISESVNEEILSQQFEEQRITIPSDLVFDRHTPQVIDQDVEQFQSNLDQLLQGFRNSALQQFCSIKKDMLMQQANVIENEKRKCTTTVAIKQDELEHAKEEIARLTSELQSIKIQRNSLALICGTNRSKMRILQLYSKTYRSIYLFSKYTK